MHRLHTCTHRHACIGYTHEQVCAHTHTGTHAQTHVCTRAHRQTHVHTETHIHTYNSAHTHTFSSPDALPFCSALIITDLFYVFIHHGLGVRLPGSVAGLDHVSPAQAAGMECQGRTASTHVDASQPGGWKSELGAHPAWSGSGKDLLPARSVLTWRQREPALIPLSIVPTDLPGTPPPKPSPWGLGFQHESGGDTNTQSIIAMY